MADGDVNNAIEGDQAPSIVKDLENNEDDSKEQDELEASEEEDSAKGKFALKICGITPCLTSDTRNTWGVQHRNDFRDSRPRCPIGQARPGADVAIWTAKPRTKCLTTHSSIR